MGVTKFPLNFTGLAVSIFSHSCLRVIFLHGYESLKVPKAHFQVNLTFSTKVLYGNKFNLDVNESHFDMKVRAPRLTLRKRLKVIQK